MARLLWYLGAAATVLAFLVGVLLAGLAATFGGDQGLLGAMLVLASAIGFVILGATRGAIADRWPS